MEAKKDLTLQPVAAELFARLEAGERLDSASLATIRADFAWFFLAIAREAQPRSWVVRQLAYAIRALTLLEPAEFANPNAGEQKTAGAAPVWLVNTSNTIAVVSDVEGFRYQLRVSRESGKPVDSKIYKNRLPLNYLEDIGVVLSQLEGEGKAMARQMLQAVQVY